MSGVVMTNICTDGTAFGPGSRCRQFDFTTSFENTILVILPNLLFIAIFLVFRGPQLLHKHPVRPVTSVSLGSSTRLKLPTTPYIDGHSQHATRPVSPEKLPSRIDWLGVVRVTLAFTHLAIASALVGLVHRATYRSASASASLGGWTFVTAQAIALVGACALLGAVWIERMRTRGGSFLIPLFILSSILFDGARLRTFNMIEISEDLPLRSSSFFALFAASIGIKVLLLASESVNTDAGESAEGRATWFNRLGFFWLFPLMLTGVRKGLTVEDLPNLQPTYATDRLTQRLTAAWDASAESAAKQAGKPTRSLLLAIVRTFPFVAFGPVIAKIALTAVTLAQPYLISDVITFVDSWAPSAESGGAPLPEAWGWSLAGAFALVFTVNAVGQGMYYWITTQNGVTLRGIIVGQLYTKSLRLHLAEAGTVGSSGAVTLMSADVERIVSAIDAVHSFWSGVITIAIGLYILYSQIGLVFLLPLFVTMLVLFFSPLFGKSLGALQKLWSEAIDRRLAVTSSMINGMKAVKMSGFEDFFERKLVELRGCEMDRCRKYSMTMFKLVVTTNLGHGLLGPLTFATLAIVVYLRPEYPFPFNSNTVFTALSALNVVQIPVMMIGQRFGAMIAAYASFRRIEDFLLSPEREIPSLPLADSAGKILNKEKGGTDELPESIGAKCEAATLAWNLDGNPVLHNVSVDFGSERLTMVIGPLSSGKSTLLAAVLGEPYVTSGSIQTSANQSPAATIAFSSQDCWMQETLSIRANIVFHSDQPFDQEWYDCVLDACCLRRDLDTFALGDRRLAKSLSGGQRQRVSLARAVYARHADVVVLDDPFCALDAETEALIWENLFSKSTGLLRSKTVILASNALHRMKDVDWVVRLGEGTVLQQGPPSSVKLSEDDILALETARQATAKALTKNEDEQDAESDTDIGGMATDNKADHGGNLVESEAHEKVEEGGIKMKYYHFWLRCAGRGVFASMVLAFVLATAANTGMQAYLQLWTNRSTEDQRRHFGGLLGGLLAVAVVYVLSEAADLYLCISIIPPRAGRKIHSRLLDGVLRAPLSFFDSRSNGQQRMDDAALMVASAPYLLIVLAAVSVLMWLLRTYYLPNSRQLRRLDMSTKSPLYTLFGDTTAGLAVIRAFGRQEVLFQSCISYTERTQRSWYALNACRRWLLVWSNTCAMVTNTALVIILVGLRSSKVASLAGVALSQSVNLSFMLTTVIISWCEAEIAGVVFERLYEFSTTRPERSPPSKSAQPVEISSPGPKEKSDQASGSVEFRDVILSYTPGEGNPVLNDLSFKIEPGQHVGICGRTGSGKSTILQSLLRMVERQSGEILLGGRSIELFELHELRRSIAVVGQDPLIVNGATVRENLQLEGELGEDRIWQVLRDVRLAEFVKSLSDGLDTVLDNKTARFSQGRRQLLAIARVLLNPKSVVVLDEVTSAIDEETDDIVQALLRTEFRSSTVISIAHRTASVVAYDRVMVLGDGQILEFDEPGLLLRQPDSVFRSLAKHQGVI
ncbi:hypothetical protein OC861_004794 [Tilletia horrida]|nr:hypothetical protein OC861_004794 [Tilletia horrida]